MLWNETEMYHIIGVSYIKIDWHQTWKILILHTCICIELQSISNILMHRKQAHVYRKYISANWTFSIWCVPLIKPGSLNWPWSTKILGHVQVYQSILRKTHYDVANKNNKVSSEGLDRHYHKYPSSYQTHWDISDVWLYLQICCYSIFIFLCLLKFVLSTLSSLFIWTLI